MEISCVCGGRILDADGELVCGRCGIVQGYDTEAPEPAVATAGLFEYQTGGLTTTMGRRRVDHTGRLIGQLDQAKRMLRCNFWTQKYNRSMPVAMAQLSGLRDKLRMTDAASEYAAYLLRKAVAADFLVGRKVSHCTAAVAYIACRKYGINRTMADMMKATGLKKHDIYRAYRQLFEKFDPDLPVPDPAAYVTRIGEACGVSEATRRNAQEILYKMDRLKIAGKDPMGLAAGVLYLSCVLRGEMVLRRQIAEAAGVAETTISNRYNALVSDFHQGVEKLAIAGLPDRPPKPEAKIPSLWHRRSMPAAMAKLSELCDKLRVTDACSKYAADLFCEVVSSGFMVGRALPRCMAAAALLACRKHDSGKTIRDIVKATGLKKHDIYRAYRQLFEKFDPDLPVPDPAAYVTRIGEACGVSEATRRNAQEILYKMDRLKIAGKDPMGLAAGVLYLSCVLRGEMVLRRQIAEAAGVAETTISNRYNMLSQAAQMPTV